MSAAQETQSMWEIRLLRGRLLCKGGGLTGMSEAAWPNDMKLCKKHLWKILYRDYSFRFDPFTNMAATGNSCFRLVNF